MIGFNEKDSAILTVLGKRACNMLAIAQATDIHERTVAYRLHKLRKLGVVEVELSKGKQKVWRLSNPRRGRSPDIEVYRGRYETARAQQIFWSTPKNAIIYWVSGYEYANLQNKSPVFDEVGRKSQATYRRRGVILKSIAHTKALEKFSEMLNPSAHFLEGRRKRSLATTFIHSRPSLLGPCAYAIAPHAIYITNVKKDFALVIREKAIVTLFYEMASLLYELVEYACDARFDDMNEVVERTLAKQKEKKALS